MFSVNGERDESVQNRKENRYLSVHPSTFQPIIVKVYKPERCTKQKDIWIIMMIIVIRKMYDTKRYHFVHPSTFQPISIITIIIIISISSSSGGGGGDSSIINIYINSIMWLRYHLVQQINVFDPINKRQLHR